MAKGAEEGEGGVAVAWGESRDDDGVDKGVVGIERVDVLDCRLCCVEALVGRQMSLLSMRPRPMKARWLCEW